MRLLPFDSAQGKLAPPLAMMPAWGGERFQIAYRGGVRGFGEVIGTVGVVGAVAGVKTSVKRM